MTKLEWCRLNAPSALQVFDDETLMQYMESAWLQHSNNNVMRLYHGSPCKSFTPTFGFGEEKHDYGKGFYTTEYKELAREWAVCLNSNIGYMHSYELNLNDLKIFNFNNATELNWMAELMSHRAADSSTRYKRLSKEFIAKFKLDISDYDVIIGWRADSSYFSIAKRFVRNEIDYTLIDRLFHLGNLQNQICLKSEKAFAALQECAEPEEVDNSYFKKYTARDKAARDAMEVLINSTDNTMQKGFDYVLREEFHNEM